MSEQFVTRFQRLQKALQRTYRWTTLGWAIFGIVIIVAALAAVDYVWEIDRFYRVAGLALGTGVCLSGLAWGIWQSVVRWNMQPTAAELEQHFPELGQRVRTTVQYAGHQPDELARDGVVPELVDALSGQTEEQVAPLPVDDIVPRRRMWGALVAAVVAVVALAVSPIVDWEWRHSLARLFYTDQPFTTITVTPGNITIDEGESLDLSFEVWGRPRQELELLSRDPTTPDAAWLKTSYGLDDAEQQGNRWSYTAHFSRLKTPMEYQVVAGEQRTPVSRVDIRYPLEMQHVEALLSPPTYTGLKPKKVEDGNLNSVVGSHAEVSMLLDRAPEKADIHFARLGRLKEGEERTWTAPVTIEGNLLKFPLEFEFDYTWTVQAVAADGTSLPEAIYRVRVRPDQPPRISFQEPEPELEVHTLAEVMMKTRASDDYGLTRSGIAFRINNGEEHLLPEENFQEVAEAIDALESEEVPTLRTRATLERTLPLEYFSLTQKDSVMYYAYAEDNFPGTQRTESEFRFIDIRPFRINFREQEAGMRGGGMGDNRRSVTALEELIRRERYTLNRTVKLGKGGEDWDDKDLSAVDRLVEYQGEIAALTRELAVFLEELGLTDDLDPLFQAETAMLAAADSLSVGGFDSAAIQETDAQQYLVEARNRLNVILMNNPNLRAQLSLVNKRIQQKLRRKNNNANLTQSLVQRLKALSQSQQRNSMAANALAMAMSGGGGKATENNSGKAGMSSTGDPMENAGSPPEGEPQASEDTQGKDPMSGEPMESEGAENASDMPPTEGGEKPEEMETGTSDDMNEREGNGLPTVEELEDQQYEDVVEAEEILDRIAEIQGLTDLFIERLSEATKKAEEAGGMLARGDTQSAANETAATAEMFDELSQQAQALVANEVSERIVATRNLSARLAQMEREILEDVQGQGGQADSDEPQEGNSGTGDTEEMDEEQELAGAGSRLRMRSETVNDILQAMSQIEDADLADAAAQINELIESQQTGSTLERVMKAAAKVEAAEVNDEVETELEDTAERVELAAAELDRIYRGLVMPRMARLRELDAKLNELRGGMEGQQNKNDVAGWTSDFQELLRDLEKVQGGGATREELREQMEENKFPSVQEWTMAMGGGVFVAPADLRLKTKLLAEELRQQIYELLLSDMLADRNEASPAEYEQLIDRYFRVLSKD